MGDFAQFWESDCGVDEIAKDDLPCFNIAGKTILNPLAQERLAKTGIALNARPDCFLKISVSKPLALPLCSFSLLVVLP
jgi:hypothetical protein